MDEQLPPHPMEKVGRIYFGLAGLCVAVTTFQLVTGAPSVVWPLLAASAGWSGLGIVLNARAVALLNRAAERFTRGQIDEAEQLLTRLPKLALRMGAVGSELAIQRARIALCRGDAPKAVTEATRVLAVSRFEFFQSMTRALTMGRSEFFQSMTRAAPRPQACAIRALAHASMGHEAEASAEAHVAEQHPLALPEAIAQATLARALLLARAKDTAAIVALFAREPSMMESLSPRERMLARALRRMARGAPLSAYRTAATPESADAPDGIASWMAKFAPGASAYVSDEKTHAGAMAVPSVDTSTQDARDAARHANSRETRAASLPLRRILLWTAFALMFVVSYTFLNVPKEQTSEVENGAVTDPAPHDSNSTTNLEIALLAGLGALAWNAYETRKISRLARGARRAIARGDEKSASAVLVPWTNSRRSALAALGHLGLALLASRRADWNTCLTHSDQGLGRVGAGRAVLSDWLVPELVTARALALAALGRGVEADAERALLQAKFPTYPYAACSHFRVQLVAAARAGNLDEAATIAHRRTLDLPLPLRDDTLADVVLAASEGASIDEFARITRELDDDDSVRTWIDAVAPHLRDRMYVRDAARSRALG